MFFFFSFLMLYEENTKLTQQLRILVLKGHYLLYLDFSLGLGI